MLFPWYGYGIVGFSNLTITDDALQFSLFIREGRSALRRRVLDAFADTVSYAPLNKGPTREIAAKSWQKIFNEINRKKKVRLLSA